jgi:hypothetical protein
MSDKPQTRKSKSTTQGVEELKRQMAIWAITVRQVCESWVVVVGQTMNEWGGSVRRF